MKAAIALLADYHVQNVARKMVYEINQLGDVAFIGSLLPAHVSLKQPFTFESMEALEAWFESFSKKIHTFPVQLERVYYNRWDDAAIIGFEVLETSTLRSLHNQINYELKELFTNPSAPFDGDDYRFHLTVELGKVGDRNPFKQFYESLPEKQIDLSFTARQIDLSFTARQIALFLYPREPIEPGSFICYKTLPLTGMA